MATEGSPPPDPPLPTLDTSAARKSVRVTRAAPPPPSAGHSDTGVAPAIARGARRWAWATFALGTLGAGAAVSLGAPAAVLLAPVPLGLGVGALVRRMSHGQAEIQERVTTHATSREILSRLPRLKQSLDDLNLNPEIHADMLQSLDAIPGRLQRLDQTAGQCQAALDQTRHGDPNHSSTERQALEDRIARAENQRQALMAALDRLVLSATQIGTEGSLDSALEQTLLSQAQAAATTADDLK